MQDVSTVLLVSTVMLVTRRRARGVDEVFIPIGSNLDQSKLVNWMRSVPVQGWCAFPARSTPDHKSYRFKKGTRDDQQSHYSPEGGDLGRCRTQGLVEKTATVEKLHATVNELEASVENLAMKVAKLFAQVFNQVDNDPIMKVKKLIQDLIWKLQWRFLRKADCDTELSTTNCPETSLREEVCNANFIRYEEKAIKDVQDAQSNLTQAIQILTDFYTKVIQNDFSRLESETTATESEAVHTFDEFTGKAVNSGAGRRECHAGGVRAYSLPSDWESSTVVCLSCER